MDIEKFWLENPKDLFVRTNLLVDPDDSFNEKLNTLTKLVIIVAIVMAIFRWKHWLTFLVVALLLILFAYLINQQQSESHVEHFNEDIDNFTYYNNRDTRATPHSFENHTKMENELQPLESCYTHIVAAASRSIHEPPQVTYLHPNGEVLASPLVEGAGCTPSEFPVSIGYAQHIQQPPEDVVVTKRKQRKTAYDLQKEAYQYEDRGDQVQRDRDNLINGLL